MRSSRPVVDEEKQDIAPCLGAQRLQEPRQRVFFVTDSDDDLWRAHARYSADLAPRSATLRGMDGVLRNHVGDDAGGKRKMEERG